MNHIFSNVSLTETKSIPFLLERVKLSSDQNYKKIVCWPILQEKKYLKEALSCAQVDLNRFFFKKTF